MGRDEYFAQSAEKICSHCGGRISIFDTKIYRYKIVDCGKTYWFCIWSCMEAWRREHEKPTKKGRADKVTVCHHGRYPNRMREIREYFGLERREVFGYIGCSAATYSHFENGVRRIPPKRMARLCEGFGCRPADILSDRFDAAAAENWECRIKKKSTYPPR